MLGLRQLSILCVVLCATTASSSTVVNAETVVGSASRNLRVQHNGAHDAYVASAPVASAVISAAAPTAPAAAAAAVASQDIGRSHALATANPGGILGPLYAAFPDLLKPLALLSDTIHNTNAALTGVQHTPDGIFQA